VSLEVVAQLPGCNEKCIEQLMHFQVPYFGVMKDLTNVVHRVLDGTTPLGGSGSSTSTGLDPEGSWLQRSGNASGCQGAVALLVPPCGLGAGDASGS
jgi:hypothetical protein